jgi:hypothetical protein
MQLARHSFAHCLVSTAADDASYALAIGGVGGGGKTLDTIEMLRIPLPEDEFATVVDQCQWGSFRLGPPLSIARSTFSAVAVHIAVDQKLPYAYVSAPPLGVVTEPPIAPNAEPAVPSGVPPTSPGGVQCSAEVEVIPTDAEGDEWWREV